ncbi:hydrogenase isoenzymes nickel incorporation protein [Escherichia coli]|uniref:Hydrogenase isoenzymes nickel incorporation protein n=1 Tax=Escherichia coli TaxID=562 RepID=A0A376KN58_ECOLX|nr:hydrogenase isoenzymes nickel incorporation protein [Escherichia coli]
MSQRRMLEVEIDVLDKNNRLAERNRARFAARKPTGAQPGFQPWFR